MKYGKRWFFEIWLLLAPVEGTVVNSSHCWVVGFLYRLKGGWDWDFFAMSRRSLVPDLDEKRGSRGQATNCIPPFKTGVIWVTGIELVDTSLPIHLSFANFHGFHAMCFFFRIFAVTE